MIENGLRKMWSDIVKCGVLLYTCMRNNGYAVILENETQPINGDKVNTINDLLSTTTKTYMVKHRGSIE